MENSLKQQLDAVTGLCMAMSGKLAAMNAAHEALLIAAHQRDPALLPLLQQHLQGLTPHFRAELTPEQDEAFDSHLALMRHKLELLQRI